MAKVLRIGYEGPKRRHRAGKILLCILLVLLLALLFLNSSFFAISQVTVEGNQQVTKETIMDNLNIVEGTNMFRYLLNNWKADHTMDPKIDTADVYLNWPNAITVQVTERTTVGYVPHMGTYLCVDKNGYVLDSTYYLEEELPIVQGVRIESYRLGEVLNTKDSDRYELVLEICAILQKYSLTKQIVEINVSNLDALMLYTTNLDISCGSFDNFDQKMVAVGKMLENDENIAGILHVEDLTKQVYIENKL